jgi:hypothetical protein
MITVVRSSNLRTQSAAFYDWHRYLRKRMVENNKTGAKLT